MYLVSERKENKDYNNIPKTLILKIAFIVAWILTMVSLDLILIKKKALQEGKIGFIQLGIILALAILAQAYGWYLYDKQKHKLNTKNNKNKQKQVSIGLTIIWHSYSFFKLSFIGLCLSNSENLYIPTYFLIRMGLYSSALFVILSHLLTVYRFVIYKGEFLYVLHKQFDWMADRFYIIFYASVFGINLDVVAFGNEINFYVWLILMSLFLLYLANKIISTKIKSILFKNLFESE